MPDNENQVAPQPPNPPPRKSVYFDTAPDKIINDSILQSGSTTESVSSSGRRAAPAPALQGNLTREQRDRDPLFYYQVESVLGIGSMGSVVKVSKRESVIGGSARKDLRAHFRKVKVLNSCFHLPFVGGMFQYCLKGMMEFKESKEAFVDITGSGNSNSPFTNSGLSDDLEDGESGSLSPKKGQMIYAMKSIHLSRIADERYINELKNEINVLKTLDHPHIVKAIETFEHRNQIFIIMELCCGGDLYSRDPYTEEEAARITFSILSAIAYMHSKNLIHRDLKYENILFVNNHPKAEVKLIDFGLSATFGHDELTDGVGTIYTMAPEVLKGRYSKQADVWSVGVIAYMLLSSQMPFYGKKRRHIVEQIMSGSFEFNGRRWKRVSNQGKEFVRDLLVLDPVERFTAEQALSSAWLNRRFAATVRNPMKEEIESAHQSMVNYAKYSKLKQVALMVIAHRSTSEEIGILRKLFQKYDTTGRGHVTYDEFKAAISSAGFSEDAAREIFDALDQDGNGKVRYTEFLASTIEAQGAIDERRLAEAFDRLDTDDSGYITVQNLRDILGDDFPESEINDIIRESSTRKDGKISYMDFLAQWQDQKEAKRQDVMADISNMTGGGNYVAWTADDDEEENHNQKPQSDDLVLSRVNFIRNKQKVSSSLNTTEDSLGTQQSTPVSAFV